MRTVQVEIFLEVLDQGSLSAASRRLGRSRTTISSALSALEDDLGVALFERSGNQLTPTAVAETIRTDCERLVQVDRQIRARCNHHLKGVESSLRVARDDALPESFWRSLWRELKAAFPETSISVYLAPPQELQAMVEAQAVDVAYGLMPGVLSEGYHWFRELDDVRMVTVAASSHPLVRLQRVQQDDLVRHTEITMAYLKDGRLAPEAPETANYLAFTQYELIRDAVLEGSGWADLPLPLIAPALRDGSLCKLSHRNALWWKTFSAFESEQAQGGRVPGWLAERIQEYLSGFS